MAAEDDVPPGAFASGDIGAGGQEDVGFDGLVFGERANVTCAGVERKPMVGICFREL